MPTCRESSGKSGFTNFGIQHASDPSGDGARRLFQQAARAYSPHYGAFAGAKPSRSSRPSVCFSHPTTEFLRSGYPLRSSAHYILWFGWTMFLQCVASPLEDRAGSYRRLSPTIRTVEQRPPGSPCFAALAVWTNKTVGPPHADQVVPASLFGAKSRFKFHQSPRIVSHAPTLHLGVT